MSRLADVVGIESPLYRTMRIVSGSAWLTLLWVVACLPIVTAPTATVALHVAARAVIGQGQPFGWRDFLRAAWSVRRRATAAGLLVAAGGGVWAIAFRLTAGVPVVSGMLGAIALVAVVAVTALPPALLTATEHDRPTLPTLAAAIAHRPGRTLSASALWLAATAAVITLPFQLAILLALIAAPLCAAAAMAMLAAPPGVALHPPIPRPHGARS